MMFLSLSKNQTPYEQFAFQVQEDLYNKIWHRNTVLPWPQIMESCAK